VTPRLLALDFDGVVCDGMNEFFETSWRAWQSLKLVELPLSRKEELHARFARLRPVVESGWEMALLPGLLAATDPARDGDLEDGARWAEARDAHVRRHGLTRDRLAHALDSARDAWRAQDLEGWRRCHRFYPGVADWLRRLVAGGQLVYVLSTKDKRFLDDLLAWQDVPLASDHVVGKATPRRAKGEVVQSLVARHDLAKDGAGTWFVEDHLPALLEFRRAAPGLSAARLFLAEWGYVFPRDLEQARAAGIPSLTLAQATGLFDGWPAVLTAPSGA
jgi:phosphoglycolate phosphatase-like HAD superfamily hydrolase